MAAAMVSSILSPLLNPMTFMSSPTSGSSFLSSGEFRYSSVSRTSLSVWLRGAKDTPNDVSFALGISLPSSNTFLRSSEPCLIL